MRPLSLPGLHHAAVLATVEERFRRLEERVVAAEQRAAAAERYAERSAALHHEAICRLNQLATGSHSWPAP